MKSLFILAGSLLFSFTLTAQNPLFDYQTTRQEFNLSGNVKSLQEISYQAVSENGQITKGERKRQKRSWEYMHDLDFLIEFNTQGNQQKKTFYDSKGNVVRAVSYQYDAHQSVLEEARLDPEGNVTSASNFAYTYDANGRVTERRKTNADDAWIRRFEYDAAGRTISIERLDSVKTREKCTMQYDAGGNLAQLVETGNGQNLKYVFTYDSSGNVTEETWYSNDVYYMKYTYKYDAHKNITERTWYNKKGKPGITWTYTYEYDREGNWTRQVQYANGKPQYIFERTILYYED